MNIDIETALHYAAAAAAAWSARRQTHDGLVRTLTMGASWANRARANEQREPLSLKGFLNVLERPLGEWLSSELNGQLLDGGSQTLLCAELIEEVGNPQSEAEQRAMVQVMQAFRGQRDGPQRYVDFRRFIIEHPWASDRAVLHHIRGAHLRPDQVYERIGSECVVERGSTEMFAPCPRCAWPMRVQDRQVSCISDQCRLRGARFDHDQTSGELCGVGAMSPPELVVREGHRRLRYGLWRYTVLPGRVELDLAKQLEHIDGVSVTLWPELDLYDLDVRCGSHQWRVDVKDYASVHRLAQKLAERPPPFRLHVVVPNYNDWQVSRLKRRLRSVGEYRFDTCESFTRMIEREAL